ncbi:VanZ family protein [Paenibacillus frigoriresistens]|uniref:VanZ family protein n=1 Tax=Paenibacillus alginolyticus TaxID=59839 RepID=UPI001563EE16|nr:VanZ family protein [Paenibacillus frigoriresistens]NRF90514.1 VanZ family protein [Paenibacillus frigoriresistens]
MIKNSMKLLFWWSLLSVFLGAIFIFTALQTFTGENTKVQIQQITGMNEHNAYVTNAVIRKSAHVLMFGLLSIIFYVAIRRRSIWLAWICTTLMAGVDEWHQSYIPGRSALVEDVLLDSLAALIFLRIIVYIRRR